MLAHLTNRAVLRVAGADARPFLQGLLTQDVDALAPGRATWAGLLSPQGKALWDMMLHDEGDGAVLLDVEAARAEELARRLTTYRLRRPVTIEPTALAVAAAWDDAVDWPEDGRLPGLARRAVLPAAPAVTAPAAAWQERRWRMGVPEGAVELGVDRTLWLEANATELGGVSFTKGCYVGQENTARMHHRDRVRRRLLPVALAADPGGERRIMSGARDAGELRAWGAGLGMAWLRMEHVAGPLTIGDHPVAVVRPDWLPADEARAPD